MALKLEECNTLVRGNFNPHIVTPEWLAQQELWQPSKAEVALAALARGLQFRGDDIDWFNPHIRRNGNVPPLGAVAPFLRRFS